jgi:MipA family protein
MLSASKSRRLRILMSILLAIGGLSGMAQENEGSETSARIWDLTLGVGCSLEPEYYGGTGLYLQFLPIVKGELGFGKVELFAGTSGGAGIGIELGESIPVALSLGIDRGKGRNSSDASAFEGLPDVVNAFRLFGSAEIDAPILGNLGLELTYLPTSVDYLDGRTKYDAILIDISIERKIRIGRGIRLEVGIGADWMNADYAQANYGIIDETARMRKYSPGPGMRSISGSLGATFMLSKNIGASLSASGDCIVGDAAESPIVDRAFQPNARFYAFYRF